ncbi:MAG TPA: GRP family sugar transporter [Coleofasciculaceae cyanobacterium]
MLAQVSAQGLGWLGALVAALFWGSYLVPVKRLPGLNPVAAQLGMAIGISLLGLPLAIASGSWLPNGWGLLAGAIWAVGNYGSIFVVRSLGLARGLALWAAVGIAVSFLWGAVVFREPVVLGRAIGGVLLLIGGIGLMNRPDRSRAAVAGPPPDRRQWLLCAGVGLLFGSQSVPFAFAHQSPIAFLPSMSLGILLTALMLAGRSGSWDKLRIPRSALLPLVVSGLLWNIANLGSFFAVEQLGFAVGMPLTQFAIMVNAAWGLLFFREIASRQQTIKVALGALLGFGGIILIGLSSHTGS